MTSLFRSGSPRDFPDSLQRDDVTAIATIYNNHNFELMLQNVRQVLL